MFTDASDIKRKRLKLLLIVLIAGLFVYGLYLWSPNPKQPSDTEEQCAALIQHTWLINREQKTIKSLAVATEPSSYCETETGSENVILELLDKQGVVAYETKLSVNLYQFYDYVDAQGVMQGGVVPAKEVLVTAYLPSDKQGATTIRLRLVRDNSLMAQGVR